MTPTETIHKTITPQEIHKGKKPETAIIKELVNDYFNCDISIVGRNNGLPDYRKIYALLCKENTYASVNQIAKEINQKHCTAVVQLTQAENLIETNRAFRDKYNAVKKLMPKIEHDHTNMTIPQLKERLNYINQEDSRIRAELKKRTKEKYERKKIRCKTNSDGMLNAYTPI